MFVVSYNRVNWRCVIFDSNKLPSWACFEIRIATFGRGAQWRPASHVRRARHAFLTAPHTAAGSTASLAPADDACRPLLSACIFVFAQVVCATLRSVSPTPTMLAAMMLGAFAQTSPEILLSPRRLQLDLGLGGLGGGSSSPPPAAVASPSPLASPPPPAPVSGTGAVCTVLNLNPQPDPHCGQPGHAPRLLLH